MWFLVSSWQGSVFWGTHLNVCACATQQFKLMVFSSSTNKQTNHLVDPCPPHPLGPSPHTVITLLPSLPRFLKGLQVAPVLLSDELKAALATEPSPGGVQYIIATQVRPVPTAGTS